MGQEDLYRTCRLCPNLCGVDRLSGVRGRCGETSNIRIAWAGLHRGEEPPVSGKNGSGTVFFSGCPLHCRFCQNYIISTVGGYGMEVTEDQLAKVFLGLQEMGAASLDLVTATHFIPSVTGALETAHRQGLNLPVVWNSSGYETVEALKLIDPYVDLYLLDAKTLNSSVAGVFCGLPGYAEAIVPVMRFLKRRRPETRLEKPEGVLIRHLVFPGTVDSTVSFLHWFADNFRHNFRLSLMVQFVPPRENPGFEPLPEKDYSMLLELLDTLGIDGFVQEQDDNEILWIPDFTRDNPFPSGFADPLPYFLRLRGV